MIRLILAKAGDVQKKFLKSIKSKCCEESGVVILTTKPFENVKKTLEKEKIDTGKMLFIDTVGEKNGPRTIATSSGNLSALSMTITESLQAMGSGERFLIFDSLTPLLVSNSPESLSRFFLFLLKKLNEWEIDADIIVTKDKTSINIVSLISESVDKILN